jgi:hypothetical protein
VTHSCVAPVRFLRRADAWVKASRGLDGCGVAKHCHEAVARGGVDLVHLRAGVVGWKKFLNHGILALGWRCGWNEGSIFARKTKRTQEPQKP